MHIGIEQTFETGGQREARIRAAQALLDRETALAEAFVRAHLRDVAVAFLQGLAADARLTLWRGEADWAALQLDAHAAPPGAAAQTNMISLRIARARADANIRHALGEQAAAYGRLRALLAIPVEQPFTIAGDLREHSRVDADVLFEKGAGGPELEILALEIEEAEAEARLARAARRPNVTARLSMEREGDERAFLVGGSLQLPAFGVAQTQVTSAETKRRQLDGERDAIHGALANEVRTVYDVYRAHAESASISETSFLPAVTQRHERVSRSYQDGELPLSDLLESRVAVADAQLAHLEHVLEAAVSAVALQFVTGTLR